MNDMTKPFPLSAWDLISYIQESVMITDDRTCILAVNPAFTRTTGYAPHEVTGQSPRMLKSGRHQTSFYRKMWSSLERTGSWQGEIINKRKNGDAYTEWLTITAIKDATGRITNYLGVFSDITRKKRAEDTIRYMAYYDPLTGLPNRTLFKDRLRFSVTQANRHKEHLAVLFLDLDQVKVINDTLGHGAGDTLLKGVSERLQRCLREGDTVARLSGDEFMILLPIIKDINDVLKVTDKIFSTLRAPFELDGHEIFTSASIGISLYPQHGVDPETLAKNADTAMNQAKRHGRNNFQFFTPDMRDEMFEQLALGNTLRRALDKNEFTVHYQPQLDVQSEHITGMEALVRWNHPDLGLVPPSRFIHWAEESGLIVPLGEWVMKEACQQTKGWHKLGFNHLRVGVNLSARQFDEENLVKTVIRILEETDLDPNHLDLELTESVLVDNAELLKNIPYELQKIGIKFSIDDFGKGYSSLSYLKEFPAHTLKMDQSFVEDITKGSNGAAIASAVIALGHSLHLTVLAEGVETQEQLDFLRAEKCDLMQGFLLSRPVPADEFEDILKTRPRFSLDSLFSHLHVTANGGGNG